MDGYVDTLLRSDAPAAQNAGNSSPIRAAKWFGCSPPASAMAAT